MEFGRRLLPQILDRLAQTEPSRVYASLPISVNDLSDGYQDVTVAKLASIVNRMSWWLKSILGVGSLSTIAYIGPADIRYAVMFLTAVKCGYKMLFVSPRNRVHQNQRMLERSDSKALLYAEELATVVEALTNSSFPLLMKIVPSLDELLKTPEDTEHYPYEKSFDEARDEPCLILHSSGSTGDPKLVTMTHGTFSVTDNDRNMPVPEGRKPLNGSIFNFEGGGKFWSCFPPYHLAGVQAYINLPLVSTSAVVFGPTNLPPSGYLLSQILKVQPVRALYVPPFIVEQWFAEPAADEQAKQVDYILFAGGPLSPQIGDKLSQVTNVCSMYGSLEMGQIQLLVPRSDEWSYMELNPFEEPDMQPMSDGTFELVLHQEPKFASRRSLWHNFPGVKTWQSGDLFVPHPSKRGLWRFCARVDDLVVFSSSHKLRPLEMETIIQGDPLLSGGLIAGQGRPGPILIVEPKPGVYDGNPEPFIDRIWQTVQEANKIAPPYAKIHRSMVLITHPEKPFLRAPKGSIVRKLTVQSYADEIDMAYANGNPHMKPNGIDAQSISGFLLPGLKQFVRKHLEEFLPGVSLSDTDNILLRGLDSLGSAGLSRSLQNELAMQIQSVNGPTLSLRMIYKYPTIEGLASVILNMMSNCELPDMAIENDVKSMQHALEEFTKDLPQKGEKSPALQALGGINVALIGPRGSLGPNILRELISHPQVAKVYCLNRGDDGRDKMRAIFKDRNLLCGTDEKRLFFMSIQLGKPKLGLSDVDYFELLQNANVIIHNAWKVDFSWTLESYKVEHLYSIRELVVFSSLSALKPRIVFVSSIASVQDWAAIFPTPVTEKPVNSYDVTSPLGYGQSKHVTERILERANSISGTPVTILRLGQVAGPTTATGGQWSTDEWLPSLAAISKTLKLIPIDIPPIDWVPVDLAASAICDLALVPAERDTFGAQESMKRASSRLQVFNIVNPKVSQWATFVEILQKRLGEEARQVSLAQWVDCLIRTDPKSMSEAEATSSMKILPFFQHMAETSARGITMQPKFETSKAVTVSKTMAEMGAIDETLINLWLQQWNI
ncbi:Non-canonical non-ribosomal peptide synthetase FUB8-like protein [Cladobotryum mycophilum]|uniref:Non-canonical non-ribosomal peptide synthetase FUB8-like protein n=1 Tax=Cladobotryum mycophilum TaxID=491253 RepID=A0ABR0SHP5_9HYPO